MAGMEMARLERDSRENLVEKTQNQITILRRIIQSQELKLSRARDQVSPDRDTIIGGVEQYYDRWDMSFISDVVQQRQIWGLRHPIKQLDVSAKNFVDRNYKKRENLKRYIPALESAIALNQVYLDGYLKALDFYSGLVPGQQVEQPVTPDLIQAEEPTEAGLYLDVGHDYWPYEYEHHSPV